MGTNYSEQIFQSIDTIISQRLNEVSFDKTEICEIISIDEKIINKYLVSNGSLKYEAYSDDENRKYLVGSKVYVRINNGDYGLKKIITGSYTADEIPKNLYTNPFNHLVVSSKYNWITETNKLSAIAHKDKTTDQDAYLAEDLTFYYSGLGQFNYIGLEFAATTGFGGTTGEFQIIIDLLDDKEKSLLSKAQLGLLTLSSKQLYGNPYYLNSNLKFQHLFNFPVGNFSDLTKVKKVKITLVTKGNFNYIEKNNLSVIINDLTIFFGFDSSENKKMSENKVALVLDNTRSLEYTAANDKKQMSIDWRDLNSGAIYNETLNMQYPEAEKYNIYWLQYSESIGYAKKLEANGGIDIAESGTYWKTVKRTDAAYADAYTYELSPSADWKKEQIKVIIKKVGTNDYIESNGLTFTNTKFRAETGTNQGSKDTLRLTLSEGDDGIYNSYGIDNKLLYSYNLEHSLTVDYIDNTVWNKDLQKVIWKIPKNATMIKQPDGWSAQGNFYVLEVNNTSNTDGKTIKFKLSDQFSYNKTNNTIYCEIIRYKDENSGIVTDSYQGSITLQFGLQGTNGTGWSFNIISNRRALLNKEDQNEMTLTATFEDSEGNPIADSNWDKKVKWSWYQTQYDTSNTDRRYSMSETTGKTTVITRNDYVDCYAIIQAKLEDWQDKNGNKIDLVAYMPIAAGNPSYYLTGASRVVYNNQGTSPSYDEAPYVLYKSDHTIVNANHTYKIISPELTEAEALPDKDKDKATKIIGAKNKMFALNDKEKSLKPLSLLPTRVPKMALQVYDNENEWASYIQPILVLKNGYQSKLLNEWNGTLTIDKTNNSIFSALMGAGVKNADNTFTGVLLGAVGKEITSAKTGIYGIASGERRYSLDELGNFYVGTGSDNRIDFSGTGKDKTLTIEAKKFTLKINNSEGANQLYLGSTANTNGAWLQFKDKVYFYSDGTATIGGWSIDTDRMYKSPTKDNGGTGLSATRYGGNPAFWAGYTGYGNNPWEHSKKRPEDDTTSWEAHTKCYITNNGVLHATGANIQGKFTVSNDSTIAGETASIIVTDKNKIKMAVFNDKGESYIQINTKNISALTKWKDDNNSNIQNIAQIETTANKAGAAAKLLVTGYGTNGVKVSSAKIIAGINGNDSYATIQANKINLTGYVTVSGLKGGTTTINGACIKTGTIDADRIDAENLTVNAANVEGTLTAATIKANRIEAGTNSNAIIFNNSNSQFNLGNVNISNDGITLFGVGSISRPGDIAIEIYGGDVLSLEANEYTKITSGAEIILSNYDETNGYTLSGTTFRSLANGGEMYANKNCKFIPATGGKAYVGDKPIATDSSGPSSINVKTNLQTIDLHKFYNDFLKIQLYEFDYKYQGINNKNHDFGFIIEELENLPYISKFITNYETLWYKDNNVLQVRYSDRDDDKYELFQTKEWDRDSYIKMIFVGVRALYEEFLVLKNQVNEIKEIKQNEI